MHFREEAKERIKEYHKLNELGNRYLVLAPYNAYTQELESLLIAEGICVDAYLDNGKSARGLGSLTTTVNSLDDCCEELEMFSREPLFLVASSYWEEICDDIKNRFGNNVEILVLSKESPERRRVIQGRREYFLEKQKEIKKGLAVWNSIKGGLKYGRVIALLTDICMGDIAIILYHIRNIAINSEKPICVLIVRGFAEIVVSLYRIPNCRIISLSKEDAKYLSYFHMLCPECMPDVETPWFTDGSDSFWYWTTFPLNTIPTMMDLYGCMLDDPYGADSCSLKAEELQNEELVELQQIKKKIGNRRAILISPYAKSTRKLPKWFWIKLVALLKERGYAVYTNCGSSVEKEIPESERLFFSLGIIHEVLSCFDWFIASRSGLCDIACGADCKKILFYESDRLKAIAGLNNNGISNMCTEIVFGNWSDYNCLIHDVIERIKQYE